MKTKNKLSGKKVVTGRVSAKKPNIVDKPKDSNGRPSAVKPTNGKSSALKRDTWISFVLDETGSMQACYDATISGFNEYIESMTRAAKDNKIKITMTQTQFNSTKVQIVHNGVLVEDIPKLDHNNYRPDMDTPLYDAIGRTISEVKAKLATMKTKPAILFVIMTDGQENASKEYNLATIRSKIQECEKEGWTFVYMGANQDAWAVGSTFGMHKGNTMSYTHATTGQAVRSAAVASVSYARTGSQQTQSFFSDPTAVSNKQSDSDNQESATEKH